MPLLGILINCIIIFLVLLVVFIILKKILETAGHPEFVNYALIVVLLIGLIWFLGAVGLMPYGGTVYRIGATGKTGANLYTYRVRSCNSDGCSNSNEVTLRDE